MNSGFLLFVTVHLICQQNELLILAFQKIQCKSPLCNFSYWGRDKLFALI